MSASAKLVEAFIGIALIPDSGATYFYTKMLGYAKAFEFATLNKPIAADRSIVIGIGQSGIASGCLPRRIECNG